MPSSHVKVISHGMSTFEQHSIEQCSTGSSPFPLTVVGSLLLRAARDQVLPRACTNIVVEEVPGVVDLTNKPSTSARTCRKALARMSTDRALGKV